MFRIFYFVIFSYLLLSAQCGTTQSNTKTSQEMIQLERTHEVAYFASGCFWCVEAVFESVNGVKEVISGYAGGKASDANYSDVSAGRTDHAESVAVYYDKDIIDYKTLLIVFFGSQDPTTLNQQGPDRGRQYRSAIFYTSEEERKMAENYIAELDKQGIYDNNIVTEVVPFKAFYPAEDYHQNYERRNPNNPYVRNVSIPRLEKFKKAHPEYLKKEIQD